MCNFHCVYVIDSQSEPGQYYIGFTEDLDERIRHHNTGAVPSTAPYRPWAYRTCIAFNDRQRALEFGRYSQYVIVWPLDWRQECCGDGLGVGQELEQDRQRVEVLKSDGLFQNELLFQTGGLQSAVRLPVPSSASASPGIPSSARDPETQAILRPRVWERVIDDPSGSCYVVFER